MILNNDDINKKYNTDYLVRSTRTFSKLAFIFKYPPPLKEYI